MPIEEGLLHTKQGDKLVPYKTGQDITLANLQAQIKRES